ncbi:Flp pilus assembly complex ATPase component TadA [bacterium]|nr:Flp pilus assembly complex ATPase component TadA [candidate division CSSED10-310 bacterium]
MKLIGELLLELGAIDQPQLTAALARQSRPGKRLGDILRDMGAITEEQVLRALATQFDMHYAAQLEPRADLPMPRGLQRGFLERNRIVPLAVSDGELIVAVNDPTGLEAIDAVAKLFEIPARPILAGAETILRAADRLLAAAGEQTALLWDLSGEEPPAGPGLDAMLSSSSNLPPVIRMVNFILLEAVRESASDIHLEDAATGFRIRYRIDGVLNDVHSPPKKLSAQVIARIKVMAGLNVAEKRLPQDGRIRIRTRDRDIDIRVATIPAADGERIVLRLLDRARALLPLDAIGLATAHTTIIDRLLSRSTGMILITGPTGSGKTTTLYAMLNQLNSTDRNIITIEDPVEYRLDGISQLPVNLKTGFTFAAGLRSILRQDPDVIMVGEIRDEETARIAVQAAMTGHLVLSTLHTNSALDAVNRLRDMGIEPYLIADSVIAVIGQRLVRTPCPHCRRRLSEEQLPVEAAGGKIIEAFTAGAGCQQCRGTGYKGRTGVFELVELTGEVHARILGGAPAAELTAALVATGYESLRQDGYNKVRLGLTTMDEARRLPGRD